MNVFWWIGLWRGRGFVVIPSKTGCLVGFLQPTNKHIKAIKGNGYILKTTRYLTSYCHHITTVNCNHIFSHVFAFLIFYISTSSIFIYNIYIYTNISDYSIPYIQHYHCMQLLTFKCPSSSHPSRHGTNLPLGIHWPRPKCAKCANVYVDRCLLRF